jgi:hypothetical protein
MRATLDFHQFLWSTRGYALALFRLTCLPLFYNHPLSRSWRSRGRQQRSDAWPAANPTIARLPDLASRGSPAAVGHSQFTHRPHTGKPDTELKTATYLSRTQAPKVNSTELR